MRRMVTCSSRYGSHSVSFVECNIMNEMSEGRVDLILASPSWNKTKMIVKCTYVDSQDDDIGPLFF